jgi:uncharacterized protein YcbX
MIQNRLSRHAAERMYQRGATERQIAAVMRHADRSARRGNGTEIIWMSSKALARLGPRTPEGVDVDRVRNLRVLVADDETVVTIVKSRNRSCLRSV